MAFYEFMYEIFLLTFKTISLTNHNIKMKNYIFSLLILAAITTNCGSATTKGWSEGERTKIRQKCIKQIEQERLWIDYGVQIPKQKFCNCVAAELEKNFSAPEASNRMEQVGLRLMAPDCLPTTKPDSKKP